MMNVSRETERLELFAALLRKWNPAINLIAPGTLNQIESRHIADALQLARLSSAVSGAWIDLGAGGGLPGLVIAIARPELAIRLVESDQRKAAFLRNAIRELALGNAEVLCQRIESADPQNADNISARALAPLPLLMAYVDRHLLPQGKAWLMKGRSWQAEVAEARKIWNFELKAHQSSTDPDAAILEIAGIRHV
jgi:16S rRNA (guanine527-N7)-methyltransferase